MNKTYDRYAVLAKTYDELVEIARRNRRFSEYIMNTRVMGARIENGGNRWIVMLRVPAVDPQAADIIYRSMQRAAPWITITFC